MLQSLLTERFKLVVHKDSQPFPAYVLLAEKKPLLKEGDGSGDTGCRVQDAPAGDGVVRLTMMNSNGTTSTMALAPGGIVHYLCRNMTMAAFRRRSAGHDRARNLGNIPVFDKTDIAGRWNFDVKWSTQINGPATANAVERISVADALEKQLGLKLEQEQAPTPVLVVDSAERGPTANAPEVSKVLPVQYPPPTAFEVAEVKPTDPDL